MIFNLKKDLKKYNAHLLAHPKITPAEIKRDEFITDSGQVIYSDPTPSFTTVEFEIEFKGTPQGIRSNMSAVSAELECTTVTLETGVYYYGRYIAQSIKVLNGFGIVEFKGEVTAHVIAKSITLDNGINKVNNEGHLISPADLNVVNKSGGTITISGFYKGDNIKLNKAGAELVLDSNGVSTKNTNGIEIYSIPKLVPGNNNIRVSGLGTNDIAKLTFKGLVLC